MADAEKSEAELKAEALKAKAAEAQAQAAEAASQAAAAGKKEGKKKMGYLARGVKSKYLEKSGNLQLPEEEVRRRQEYMQPLLDGLKTAKASYASVRSAAEKAVANAKASSAASIDFALAVCDTEYLKASPCAPALPSFQEAHHEISKISATFIETVQTRVLDVATNAVEGVDNARDKKQAYYEERQNYDFALLKLQEAAKKMQAEEEPAKKQKADEAFVAAQTAFKQVEPAYREAERQLAEAISAVVAAKGKDDADFLATIVEAQAARAAASKAVLDKLQPTLGPRPSLLSPAESHYLIVPCCAPFGNSLQNVSLDHRLPLPSAFALRALRFERRCCLLRRSTPRTCGTTGGGSGGCGTRSG